MENPAAEKLKFKMAINASAEKIWNVLWEDENYRKWTTVFCEGSHIKGSLREGEDIEFLSGTGQGMFSKVHRMNPPFVMDFLHLGEIQGGEKIPKDWAGVHERYEIRQEGNGAVLEVEMDTNEEFKSYFEEVFPKAMEIVKKLSEAS